MKRQRGRNRSGNPSGGNNKPQQNANRAFDSTGPENIKVRGHAQHVFEKYQQLARDASSSGDRVLAENFLQHAEHYFRVLRTLQPNRPVSDFMARDTYNSNYDIDFEDESGAQADPEPTQAEAQPDGEANAQGGQSGERQDYQSRDNRDQNGRDQNGYRDNRDQNQNRDQNRNDQIVATGRTAIATKAIATRTGTAIKTGTRIKIKTGTGTKTATGANIAAMSVPRAPTSSPPPRPARTVPNASRANIAATGPSATKVAANAPTSRVVNASIRWRLWSPRPHP